MADLQTYIKFCFTSWRPADPLTDFESNIDGTVTYVQLSSEILFSFRTSKAKSRILFEKILVTLLWGASWCHGARSRISTTCTTSPYFPKYKFLSGLAILFTIMLVAINLLSDQGFGPMYARVAWGGNTELGRKEILWCRGSQTFFFSLTYHWM